MTKKLIINADDFGINEKADRAIIACYGSGTVTGMSILACGESFEHATRLAKENGVRQIGAHLALTDSFKPLSEREEIPSLVGKNGKFPKGYIAFLARYFMGVIKPEEVYRELKKQVGKIRKAGFAVTHVDSHQHIHMVPGILKIVIRIMKEDGINNIRFSMERLNLVSKILDPAAWLRNALLSFMCRLSKRILDESGIKYNDSFIGHAHALRFKKEDFMNAISSLKDGATELGCHPGNREEEADVLCNKEFLKELHAHSIELVSY